MMNLKKIIISGCCTLYLSANYDDAAYAASTVSSGSEFACCAEVIGDEQWRVLTEMNAFGREVGKISPGDRDIPVRMCYGPDVEISGEEWVALSRDRGNEEAREILSSVNVCQIAFRGWAGFTLARALRYQPTQDETRCNEMLNNPDILEDVSAVLCTDLSVLGSAPSQDLLQGDQISLYDYLLLSYIPQLLNSRAALTLNFSGNYGDYDYLLGTQIGWLPVALNYIDAEPTWTAEDVHIQVERDTGVSLSDLAGNIIRSFHSSRFGATAASRRREQLSRIFANCEQMILALRPSQQPSQPSRFCRAAIINRVFKTE